MKMQQGVGKLFLYLNNFSRRDGYENKCFQFNTQNWNQPPQREIVLHNQK